MSDAVYVIRRGTKRGEGEYWGGDWYLLRVSAWECDTREEAVAYLKRITGPARIVRLRRVSRAPSKEWEALRTAAYAVACLDYHELLAVKCGGCDVFRALQALDSAAPEREPKIREVWTAGSSRFDTQAEADVYAKAHGCTAYRYGDNAPDSRDESQPDPRDAVVEAARGIMREIATNHDETCRCTACVLRGAVVALDAAKGKI